VLDSGPFVLHRKVQIHGSFQLTGEPQGAIKMTHLISNVKEC